MTTKAAAELYLSQHLGVWGDLPFAVYNPNNLPVDSLPVIYGFNNGGYDDWWEGGLLGEQGVYLGGHICSHESYMYHDLGIVEGSRPDRHEKFKELYPEGYRMDFVPAKEIPKHAAFQEVLRKANKANGVG